MQWRMKNNQLLYGKNLMGEFDGNRFTPTQFALENDELHNELEDVLLKLKNEKLAVFQIVLYADGSFERQDTALNEKACKFTSSKTPRQNLKRDLNLLHERIQEIVINHKLNQEESI